MRTLNKWQNALFLLGGLLMVAGAGGSMVGWGLAPYVFAVGAVAFASMQALQRYDGSSFVIRRLRRIMLLSDVLFLVSAVLMLANKHHFLPIDQLTYIKYVHQNWVVTLLIAALLQLYSTHRISNELEKEVKKV